MTHPRRADATRTTARVATRKRRARTLKRAPVMRTLTALAVFASALASPAPHLLPARAQGAPGVNRPAEAPATRSRGAITVRVLDDDNQPVQNATVIAFSQSHPSRPSFDNSAARTGRYVVGNLDAGVYRVVAAAPGYVQEFDITAPASEQALYRPGDSLTIRLTKGGVVTGRVTDAEGNAVVGARVTAVRVRDAAGHSAGDNGFDIFRVRERHTDDRGVYRLYGLTPGSYVVLAGGKSQFSFASRPSAYDADVPTYYPSATRDGAVELQMQTGLELTDIDIRYRGDKGHAISGRVEGITPNAAGSSIAVVALTHSATGMSEGQTVVQGDAASRSFTLEGVADGDYELAALTPAQKDNSLFAAPLRVAVRGADVTGLRLTLAPLGSLAGRLAFEPLKAADAARPECQAKREFVPQESLVYARREGGGDAAQLRALLFAASETAPDAKGDFNLRNLRDGRHRLGVRLTDDNLYARAVTLPAVPPAGNAAPRAAAPATVDLAREGFLLQPGSRLSGALVQIAAGAALLRGRVTAGEGEQLPDNLRVYLVPTERERAEDVLRYGEAQAGSDGAFTLRNLAPGRYLLVARPAPQGYARQPARPLAWDAAARAVLRKEAEAAKNSLDLQPCQRAEDFTLRFARTGAN